jgi:phenylpyruvate tautomerase PptA (4-oxalocrotonate tautomerase family)
LAAAGITIASSVAVGSIAGPLGIAGGLAVGTFLTIGWSKEKAKSDIVDKILELIKKKYNPAEITSIFVEYFQSQTSEIQKKIQNQQ